MRKMLCHNDKYEMYVDYLKKNLPSDKLQEGLESLDKGISPQYIVGNVNFYGNEIKVNPDVLIPRFETELLVEKTISYIKDRFGNKRINILDIGTGSGCIAITLKKELVCDVVGSDISSSALSVAKDNAILNNVGVSFVQSDVFSNINEKFDVIISNPPYISYDEEIEDIVRDNEPSLALYARDNGLYFYNKIIKESKNYLNYPFMMAFEIGYLQGDGIKNIINQYYDDVIIKIEKDYSGKDRFLFVFSK